MTPNRRLRHLLAAGAVFSLVGCAASQAQGPDRTAAEPTTVGTTSGTALPVISDDDPRYLWQVLTGAGGGILLTRPNGTDQVRLATDVPGVHKHASWSPDGDRVVFVDEETETMWVAHLDGSPSTQLPGCDHDGCDYPAWSPDGSKIAYSRARSAPDVIGPASVGIEVLDLASGQATQVVSLARPLLADVPRWSPDGQQIVFGVDQMDDDANETGAAVAVVPATGGEPTYVSQFDQFLYAPDWSARTGEIVASTAVREYVLGVDLATETWDIWGVMPDGSHLRRITHAKPGQRFAGGKWTPDGSWILAFDFKRNASVKIDPDTGRQVPIKAPTNTVSPRLRPTP
jgi:Tol biopolymer transport system component